MSLTYFISGNKSFLSWSSMHGPGLVMFSAWPEQIKKMSMSYVQFLHPMAMLLTINRQLRNVLEFKSHGMFFNPSRADPAAMGRSPSTGNSYLTLPGQANAFLTLTTCVMTTSCDIFHPKEVMGEQRRVISGIPHSFEHQRMEAAVLTAFHEDTANVQIAKDSITFMTSKNGSGCMFHHFHVIRWLTQFKRLLHLPPRTLPRCFGNMLVAARPHLFLHTLA